ncbi:MAG: universal stress protein [Negativicutes bacterium]
MSQLKKILVAYDGSSHSKHALNWAIDLSLLSDAQVAAVKVFEGSRLYPAISETGGKEFPALLDEIRREDQRLMDEVGLMGHSRGVTIKCDILQGNIAEQIIKYARDDNYDLIVVGTKGHGVLEQLLMGSVTRNLVSLSRIPVLVVKD